MFHKAVLYLSMVCINHWGISDMQITDFDHIHPTTHLHTPLQYTCKSFIIINNSESNQTYPRTHGCGPCIAAKSTYQEPRPSGKLTSPPSRLHPPIAPQQVPAHGLLWGPNWSMTGWISVELYLTKIHSNPRHQSCFLDMWVSTRLTVTIPTTGCH